MSQIGDMKAENVRRAIIRTLESYPRVSTSMIGLHIRPYDRNWTVVLAEMVREGIVVKVPLPDRRAHAYSLHPRLLREAKRRIRREAAGETDSEARTG